MAARTLILGIVLLALAGLVTFPVRATPVDGEGNVHVPNSGSTENPPPQPDNGPNEPGNNVCGSGLKFAGLTRDTHDDKLGPTDPGDWFSIQLFRSESLVVVPAEAAATVTYANTCDKDPLPVSPASVTQNGFYHFRVQGSGSYKLAWTISPNDADTGKDIGDTSADAFSLSAMPSYAPQVPVTGSLPGRLDQLLGRDQDWFRLNTPLPEAPTTGEKNVAFGLLTTQLRDPQCDSGIMGLQLYGPDGLTRVGDLQMGCILTSSCITLGLSTVYAKASLESGDGAGYDFNASTSPLYFVWLNQDDTIGSGNIDTRDPWCDPVVPAVLSFLPTGNALVDEAGNVIARLPKSELNVIS
jgi:hypothetical protein